MKQLFAFLILVVLGVSLAFPQASAAANPRGSAMISENTSNLPKAIAATADTTTCKYIVAAIFTQPIASDTVVFKNGTTTIATAQWGSTAPAIFVLPFNCRVSAGTLYTTTKASSKITLIYRTAY